MRDTLPNIFRAVAVAAHWSVNKANNQPFDKEHWYGEVTNRIALERSPVNTVCGNFPPIRLKNSGGKKPLKTSCFFFHKNPTKSCGLETIVHSNEQTKRHLVDVGAISCVKAYHITKVLKLLPTFSINPHQCSDLLLIIKLNAELKTRVLWSYLTENIESLLDIIMCRYINQCADIQTAEVSKHVQIYKSMWYTEVLANKGEW